MEKFITMEKFVTLFKQLTIVSFVAGAGAYGVMLLLYLLNVQEVRDLFNSKPAYTFGLPLSGFAALGIVTLLSQAVDGKVEFKAFGLQFTGPAGPVTLWILCYWTLVGSLKILA